MMEREKVDGDSGSAVLTLTQGHTSLGDWQVSSAGVSPYHNDQADLMSPPLLAQEAFKVWHRVLRCSALDACHLPLHSLENRFLPRRHSHHLERHLYPR